MGIETEEAPRTTVETSREGLHEPVGMGRQALVLAAAFAGGPAIGWVVGSVGGLPETARTLVCVAFVLVFFLGYAAWVARLKLIAFEGLGASLLKALVLLLFFRRKPQAAEVLPTRGRLLEMALKAQAASGSFRRVGWLVGLCAGVVAALFESATAPAARFVLVSATCVAWGYALSLLGRRGWLPVMEES